LLFLKINYSLRKVGKKMEMQNKKMSLHFGEVIENLLFIKKIIRSGTALYEVLVPNDV